MANVAMNSKASELTRQHQFQTEILRRRKDGGFTLRTLGDGWGGGHDPRSFTPTRESITDVAAFQTALTWTSDEDVIRAMFPEAALLASRALDEQYEQPPYNRSWEDVWQYCGRRYAVASWLSTRKVTEVIQ